MTKVQYPLICKFNLFSVLFLSDWTAIMWSAEKKVFYLEEFLTSFLLNMIFLGKQDITLIDGKNSPQPQYTKPDLQP